MCKAHLVLIICEMYLGGITLTYMMFSFLWFTSDNVFIGSLLNVTFEVSQGVDLGLESLL